MPTLDYLIVGGGGGGGRASNNARGGGGGGGGGILIGSAPGALTSYAITVGAGGTTSNTAAPGNNGGDSILAGVATAPGGGGGGGGDGGTGADGGCGGGCGDSNGNTANGSRGLTGFAGGGVPGSGGGGGSGAGGGGATGAGANGVTNGVAATVGGAGYTSSLSGAAVTYAAGGGGGGYLSAAPGASGPANSGNGGHGGGGNDGSGAPGGTGGSGVVIIAYDTGRLVATGGTITTNAGRTIHTFTTSGTFQVTAFGTLPTVDYLAIGGGGGGGRGSVNGWGAGGGGGGVILFGSLTPTVTSYAVTVGAGGAPASTGSVTAPAGGATTIGAIATAPGGGGGAGGDAFSGSGAPGGGAGANSGVFAFGFAGTPFIFAGGRNGGFNGIGASGAGGGGATGAGANGVQTGTVDTAGGAGRPIIFGSLNVVASVGGNGAARHTGTPGANAATVGSGGSASGGSNASNNPGGFGSGGIVVFAYPVGMIQATGGTITTVGGNTVHTFTVNGTFQITGVGLAAQSGVTFATVANLARGGISFAAQPGIQLFTVADLTPGFRPPAFLLPSGYETLEDQAGSSVPGGLVWSYAAGTTTPAPTYTDSTLTIVNTNPIVCDAAGRWAAWVPIGTSYKLVFEGPAIPPAHGPLIRTVDGLQVLSYPIWTPQPYNVANYTAVGGGTWTVDPGDLNAYQFLLDGKRLALSLTIANTSIAGTVTAVKVALPAGIVSAPWQQGGPAQIFDNSDTVGTLGYWQVDANTASIFFGKADRSALAVSVNQTWIWFTGVVAIT